MVKGGYVEIDMSPVTQANKYFTIPGIWDKYKSGKTIILKHFTVPGVKIGGARNFKDMTCVVGGYTTYETQSVSTAQLFLPCYMNRALDPVTQGDAFTITSIIVEVRSDDQLIVSYNSKTL